MNSALQGLIKCHSSIDKLLGNSKNTAQILLADIPLQRAPEYFYDSGYHYPAPESEPPGNNLRCALFENLAGMPYLLVAQTEGREDPGDLKTVNLSAPGPVVPRVDVERFESEQFESVGNDANPKNKAGLKPPSERELDARKEKTYLNVIGAMWELLLTEPPLGDSGSRVRDQSHLIEKLVDRHGDKYGISERNLQRIFPEAKKQSEQLLTAINSEITAIAVKSRQSSPNNKNHRIHGTRSATMVNTSSMPKGKASVWPSASIKYWKALLIAEQQGLPPPPPPTDEELLNSELWRWPEVEKMTGIKRGHAAWLIRESRFPAPLKLPAAKTAKPQPHDAVCEPGVTSKRSASA